MKFPADVILFAKKEPTMIMKNVIPFLCSLVIALVMSVPSEADWNPPKNDQSKADLRGTGCRAGVPDRRISVFHRPDEKRVRREQLSSERGKQATDTGSGRCDTRPASIRYYTPSRSDLRRGGTSTDYPASKMKRSATRYGIASWYGGKFHGRLTSNGETYNMYAHTAAHRTMPFGTVVRVTNMRNGRATIVRINDRGPFVAGREIDLSYRAAGDLGMIQAGIERVRIETLSR
jgi:hypothetical protein